MITPGKPAGNLGLQLGKYAEISISFNSDFLIKQSKIKILNKILLNKWTNIKKNYF